jgi:nucleoside-diphosphate-sugar epimerase
MNILVTGSAGFIGSHVTESLLQKGHNLFGLDNLNDYYDINLKKYRLNKLNNYKNFSFYQIDIANSQLISQFFADHKIDAIFNLAARAGVRYSIENPFVYYDTNLTGLLNLLEMCKTYNINKFMQASTSSVYAGSPLPYIENTKTDTPLSPYAASKKGGELLCYTYHHLYKIAISILRYFTVYGPMGRPDMSIYRFIESIKDGKEITIYGDGSQERDFTYIDDIVDGTVKSMDLTGYSIINLGNNEPSSLKRVIKLIETKLNKKAKIRYEPFHKADMKNTWANIDKAKEILNWSTKIDLEDGIDKTIKWHLEEEIFLKQIKF